jgi:ABC-type bacteriocin/lantibiotic exporter with double-glycine peptidase domain
MTKIEFPQRPVAFLIYFLKSLTAWQKISISLLVLITATVVGSNFVMMYGFKLLIDLIPKADLSDVWADLVWPFWIVVGCCLFHTIMYRVRDAIDAYSTPNVMNALREMLMKNITQHSHDYFHNRFSGELVNKVNNINTTYHNLLWERVMHGFIPAISAIVSSSIILWFIDYGLAIVFMMVIAGMCLSIYFLGGYLGRASANFADCEADI